MLKILKFLYGSRFLMFKRFIRSDVAIVHSLIQIKNMQFPEWCKSQEVGCTKINAILTS